MDRTCKTCKHETTPFGHATCVLCKRSDGMGGTTSINWEPKDDVISKVESRFSPSIGGIPNAMREVVGMGELDKEEPKVIDVSGMVIKLELDDESCMSVANAICNYCVNRMGDDETALIFMEELTEHIDSAVRAKKKWLEYQKSKEEE